MLIYPVGGRALAADPSEIVSVISFWAPRALVFSKARVAVFLDGCFWHGCPEHHTVAVINAEFWADKVRQNRARDRGTDERLAAAGWTVIRIWEHEAPRQAALRVRKAVRQES